MVNCILTVLSFLFGVYCVRYLRSYDVYKKEPLSKMLLVTFCGGVWSIGISLVLYILAHKIDSYSSLIATLVIGPIEESSKLLALISCYYLFFRNRWNSPTAGIIYMSCVALGFSLIENYMYAVQASNSGELLFLRLLISTPGHIFFSFFMGISFHKLVRMKSGIGLLSASWCYASLFHSVFNLIMLSGWWLIPVAVFFKISHRWSLCLLSYTIAKSPYKVSLVDLIRHYQNPKEENGLECLYCGSKNRKRTYRLENILIQKCDQCSYYVTTKNCLFFVFHRFGSAFKSLESHYWDGRFYKRDFSTLFRGNYISDEKKIAYFDLDELNAALAEFNQLSIREIENSWWYPKAKKSTEMLGKSDGVSP